MENPLHIFISYLPKTATPLKKSIPTPQGSSTNDPQADKFIMMIPHRGMAACCYSNNFQLAKEKKNT